MSGFAIGVVVGCIVATLLGWIMVKMRAEQDQAGGGMGRGRQRERRSLSQAGG